MTEEKLNALRQSDANLRDALKMDETERPQMPADLNERLMQRMANEEQTKTRRIVIWPWIAAACVAGVMVRWLKPPKATTTDVVADNTVIEQPVNSNKVEEAPVAKAEMEAPEPIATPVNAKKAKVNTTVVKRDAALLAQETPMAQTPTAETTTSPAVEEASKDLAVAKTAKPQEKMVMMTERDIPITRPENYKYTPEELALLKKQANEAYLKWVELELEISKNNLQQTAQQ